jgi:hypothetical protein
MQRCVGILFGVQDDIEVGAHERLVEQFAFAWAVIDQ